MAYGRDAWTTFCSCWDRPSTTHACHTNVLLHQHRRWRGDTRVAVAKFLPLASISCTYHDTYGRVGARGMFSPRTRSTDAVLSIQTDGKQNGRHNASPRRICHIGLVLRRDLSTANLMLTQPDSHGVTMDSIVTTAEPSRTCPYLRGIPTAYLLPPMTSHARIAISSLVGVPVTHRPVARAHGWRK